MKKDSFALHVLHTENNIQSQARYDTTSFLSHIHKDTVCNWLFRTFYVKNVLVFSSEIQ